MKIDTAKRHVIADLFYIVLILVFSAACILADRDFGRVYATDSIQMQDVWVSETGEAADLEALPPGEVRISAQVGGLLTGTNRLCMKSIDTFFDVYADGALIYSYRPEPPRLLGVSYGMFVHAIPIPQGTQTLTLQIDPIFSGNSGSLPDAVLADAGTYMAELFKRNLPSFVRSVFNFLVGVLFLVMGVSGQLISKRMGLDFVSFGSMCVLLGFAGLNDTYLLQVLSQHPAVIRVVTYLCLIFLPYPSLRFVAEATENRETKLLPVMLAICTGNFLVSVLLTYSGLSDYYYTVRITHVTLALDFAASIYLAVKAVRQHTIRPQLVRSLSVGMTVMILCAVIDLIRYWLGQFGIFGIAGFTRFGVIVFMVLMGVYLFREQNRISLETSRAELMQKLAYTDGLTELHNRLAFGQREAQVREEGKPCFVVQLDINRLKTVNDVYGHAEGDRHIIEAAHRIRDSFSGIGDSYRTGGDEFIVISRAGCSEAEITQALSDLDRLTEAYNRTADPPVPLQIAVGYAGFDPPRNTLEEAESAADQRMYARKKQMKAGEAR